MVILLIPNDDNHNNMNQLAWQHVAKCGNMCGVCDNMRAL